GLAPRSSDGYLLMNFLVTSSLFQCNNWKPNFNLICQDSILFNLRKGLSGNLEIGQDGARRNQTVSRILHREACQGTVPVLRFFLTANNEFSNSISGEGVEDFEPCMGHGIMGPS
ncbi:MAG: hypothetical protein ACE5HR_08580, partial [bacterium]